MTLPVRSIIAFDIIIFALSIVLLDVNSMAGRGVASAVMRQARNPLLLALLFGLLVNLAPVTAPLALVRAAGFIADTAHPAASSPPVSSWQPSRQVAHAPRGLYNRHEDAGAPAAGCRADPWWGGYVLEAARTSLLVACRRSASWH